MPCMESSSTPGRCDLQMQNYFRDHVWSSRSTEYIGKTPEYSCATSLTKDRTGRKCFNCSSDITLIRKMAIAISVITAISCDDYLELISLPIIIIIANRWRRMPTGAYWWLFCECQPWFQVVEYSTTNGLGTFRRFAFAVFLLWHPLKGSCSSFCLSPQNHHSFLSISQPGVKKEGRRKGLRP